MDSTRPTYAKRRILRDATQVRNLRAAVLDYDIIVADALAERRSATDRLYRAIRSRAITLRHLVRLGRGARRRAA